ncbi:hypothetical protein DWV16_00410 [Anaerotruncus sp. AF02-27]|uniref:TRAP transporter substrate-binding protein n=1 Tax=Anaerotruncus sp. AF02-27 TaxID=2292191 RepID=UPI000E4FB803|nr:TRAP transporter substrate-binding protein [Anaerotruncus sp. AF02-27]RGX56818.1 hypothetical protein DWV16_00410 [Anaerotruncus sp. AF02-27]
MKKVLSVLLGLVLCLSLMACGSSADNAAAPETAPSTSAADSQTPQSTVGGDDFSDIKPVKIKFAHGYAGGELAVELVEEWMDLVTEKTGGAVEWEYYSGGSLGSITEIIEQTDLGAVDLTVTDTSQLQNYAEEYAILFYPFLFQSYEHQLKTLESDIMDKFSAALEENSNLHALGYYVNGVRNICSKKQLASLEDCKGVILRVPEIQVYKDTATLLGMVPTTISYSEMYTAFNSGICEAVECPNNSLYPSGYHKVGPYILKAGHMFSSCAVEFNKDFWNQLDPQVQAVLQESFDSLTAAHAEKVIAADEEFYKLYEEEGATVSEWADAQAPADASKDYWYTSAEALGGDSKDIVDAIVALRI